MSDTSAEKGNAEGSCSAKLEIRNFDDGVFGVLIAHVQRSQQALEYNQPLKPLRDYFSKWFDVSNGYGRVNLDDMPHRIVGQHTR